jgi:hypothetical protein
MYGNFEGKREYVGGWVRDMPVRVIVLTGQDPCTSARVAELGLLNAGYRQPGKRSASVDEIGKFKPWIGNEMAWGGIRRVLGSVMSSRWICCDSIHYFHILLL